MARCLFAGRVARKHVSLIIGQQTRHSVNYTSLGVHEGPGKVLVPRQHAALDQRSLFSSGGQDPGGFMSKLARRIVWAGLLMGVSAAGLLYLYSKLAEGVGKMAWMDKYLPKNMAKGLSNTLSKASDWAKKWSEREKSKEEGGREEVESTGVSHTHNSASEDSSMRERRLEKENKDLVTLMEKKEKEIHELRSALRRKSTEASYEGPKSLIDLYSEVLTLLAEFDAQSKDGKFVDQLPKVVVVGDQSAGKTSVLEMVAGARIFPRGAGEMMTRAPVMVTLSDAEDHVAEFKDVHKMYNLTKKAELKSLRSEIEERMMHSVHNGQTVSGEPISLTVRGPLMKRMVLVDLPGVISTVTTGMAADTRESIVRMCKRYMQNPNAIIMCIQDGGVDAERSIVTDLVREVDPEGKRTIFVLTKVDLAEKSGIKSERVKAILGGQLFPMKALGYYAVVAGSGNPHESIEHIQKYEKEYFARSKLFQSGTIMEKQLSTRNMVKAVNEEFWRMVQESIHDQTLKFKGLRYRLEAEWRNKFPGERVLDRGDLFEMEKANLLREVASLALVTPAKWEDMFYECLWKKMAPYALEDILMEASQAEDFSTEVDIALRKWAEDVHKLPSICALAAQETILEVLRTKIESTKGGPFHAMSQGMRGYVEAQCLEQLKWSTDNVDQLRSVQITTLEDKDVRDQDQWTAAAEFLNVSLQGQIKRAEQELKVLTGPSSLYERWVQWEQTSSRQADTQLLVEELNRLLKSEPNHRSKLPIEDVMSIQRVLKNKGAAFTEAEVRGVWSCVYKVFFLKESLRKANNCRRAFHLRSMDPQNYSCPQVVYMWRLQQLMKRCAHTLRVQLMDYEVRQLELQVKTILEAITKDERKKREIIQGFAVDKAEQLKQVRLIQEKLEAFQNALKKDKSEF